MIDQKRGIALQPVLTPVLLIAACGLIMFISRSSDAFFIPVLLFITALLPVGMLYHRPVLAESLIDAQGPATRLLKIMDSSLQGLLLAAFIQSAYALYTAPWFGIEQILNFQPASTAVILCLTFAMGGVHLVLYKTCKAQIFQSTVEKFSFYGLSVLIVALTSFPTAKTVIITVLAICIYFLLMDLFIEERKASLVWLMVWTLINGSFLTILVFDAQITERIGMPLPLMHGFSLFSFIFLMNALFYAGLAVINKENRLLPSEWNFNFSNERKLRNRIQLSILLTLVFSFLAIGVVSVYHLRLLLPPEQSPELQSRFIQALLNTYVFLFLIGFAISISLSEYIRNPLDVLGKMMKKVNINKDNKKIAWESNDEIGSLIKEYNQMIDKLQQNASLLARSERDSAWREMAKQVAHEIKNPLTPMKLSLQHLQNAIRSDRDDIKDLSLRMCETLMSQVENLRQIADEFSNFGSLPKANNEKVVLNDIVETIHDLFRKRGDMEINLIEPIDDIGVYADRNQLLRILNNLIKNSIQSIPADRKGSIELKLWKDGNRAIIRVRDNGMGIPEDMRDEIFKPRFTTKSSGSGLGLAISANMVDSIGGSLYFESTVNQGTDFYVQLPLIRSEYPESLERVSLD